LEFNGGFEKFVGILFGDGDLEVLLNYYFD